MDRKLLAAAVAATTLMLAGPALAGDAAAGKAKADACADCHEPADFEGVSEADILKSIKDVVAGEIEHKKEKVTVSDADAADIAAYWASGG